MKILILSITAGQGHHQTGLAVSNYFEQFGHEVTQMDCYEYLSPPIKEMISHGYLMSTKYSPKLYGKFYRLAEKMDKKDTNTKLMQITNTIFHKKMVSFLEENTPDVVICTHVFAALLMTYLAIKGTKFPTIGIVTDFTIHPYWETTELDYYVIANEYLMPSLLKKGVREDQILPIGIPIFEKFSKKSPKELTRQELQLENLPTILVMSGSMGFGNIAKMLKTIDTVPHAFQLITVCGNNEKLKRTIDRTKFNHPVYNYGYVNNVDKLMDAADCIITKPGGLTVSEAMAKELPMLISKPIPGQEERNLDFLLNFGCGMRISKTMPVDEVVAQIFMEEKKRRIMAENIQLIRKPDSVKDLYNHITKNMQ